MKKFFMLICAALLIAGCGGNSAAQEEKIMDTAKISIGGKIFNVALEDNASVRAFVENFPLEVEMTELNGNEKYFYLEKNLPSNSERVEKIRAGDLMLFGSNCIVIFYKDFSTSYSYTRLGKIEAADLEKVLGAGNIRVKFVR